MNAIVRGLRPHAARLVAAAVIVTLYGFARLPEMSGAERAATAARFGFARLPLSTLPGQTPRSVRAVNPSLQRISAWISSVGASIALNDLDDDGLPNDACWVDARTDQVLVAPAPGTGERYKPFALDPGPLPYDPATMAPMGCLPGDFNEDGRMDILVYYWGRTPIAFLRRENSVSDFRLTQRIEDRKSRIENSTFVPCEVAARQERWHTNAATQADLDGDGHVDLIFGNYFPEGARILDAQATVPDEMQRSMSRAYNGGRNRLLRWIGAAAGARPTVRFEEAEGVLPERVARGWTLAVGAADLDGDLLPEIYFANDFGPDRLLHNRSMPGKLRFALLEGRKTLTTPNSKVLGRDSFKGMGVDFADVNGDGLLDIYVSNIAREYALEESHFLFVNTGEVGRMKEGIAPFVDRSEPLGLSRSGWAWDCKLADFDNDGVPEAMQATGFVKGRVNRWPELHEIAMGNDDLLHHPASWHRVQPGDDLSGHERNPFFVRAGDGRYYDLSPTIGIDEPVVSRGIAIADVDGDGRLDFATANQWDTSYLYRNTGRDPGAFLSLNLRLPVKSMGVKSPRPHSYTPMLPHARSRPAIGAAATVYLPEGRRLAAQVDGGNGHSGKRSPDLHFGLGKIARDTPLRVDVRWRDGAGTAHQETLRLAPGRHTILLNQGDGRRLPL